MAKILVQYEADTSQLQAKLKGVEQANTKVDESAKKTGKTLTKEYLAAAQAAGNVSRNVSEIPKSMSAVNAAGGQLKNIFSGIAAGIGAAFAIQKVLEFGKASIDAFTQSQAQTEKLRFALENITKDGGSFDRLIKQSEFLQENLKIFDAEDIQGIQAVQAQYGLTANQIEKLTPLILELSAAQKVDLSTATDTALKAIEGQTRGLKTVGAAFTDTGNSVGNFNKLIENLAKLEGSAANELNTVSGQLKAQAVEAENLQEQIGAKLTPAFLDLKTAILGVGATLTDFVFPTSAIDSARKEINDLQNELSKRYATTPTEELKKQIEDVNAQVVKLKESAKDIPFGFDRGEKVQEVINQVSFLTKTQLALRQVVLQRGVDEKKAAEDAIRNAGLEKLAKEDLSKATKRQLTDEIAQLRLRTDANSKDVQDQIEKREKAIEDLIKLEQQATDKILAARQAASDKLKEQRLKDTQDALSAQEISNSDKLKQEQKNAEQNANILFEQSRKTKEDAENLAADLLAIRQKFDAAIEKATIDEAAKLQQEQEKIRAQNIQDIQESIDRDTLAVINGYKNQFIEVGDLSEEAQNELNDKIEAARLSGLQLQLAELKAAGESTVDIEADIADLIIGINTTKNTRILEGEELAKNERIKVLNEVLQATQEVYSEIFNLLGALNDSQIQQIEDSKNAQLDAFDAELEALELRNERGADSDRVYESKKKALLEQRLAAEKKADAELRKLKTEQAQQDKLKSIFDTILNTSTAIVAMLAQGPAGIPLSIAAGITGALQLATIIATPIPKFFEGEKFVKRGSNPIGRDTIPAMLNEGERVVTTANNKKHWEIYEAIENNEFKKFVQKHYVMPQLRAYKANQEKQSQKDFAGNIAASLTQQGLSYYDADRIRKKGMDINNTKELASLIAESLSDKLPKLYGRW
jgi:hypothetical protein